MSVADLSASTQDYLKTIWNLSEWSSAPVTTTLIAEKLQISSSSVSGALRRLSEQGLIDYTPYQAVEFTDTGRGYAVEMVRRHRLLETFLAEVLGYGPHEVHDEAEELEHAVSTRLIKRIDTYLDFPSRDPHGDPIPSEDGSIILPSAEQLSRVSPGMTVRVERINDSDPELVAFLDQQGITYRAQLQVEHSPPFSEIVRVRIEASDETAMLGRAAAEAVYVAAVSEPGVESLRN